MLAEAALYPTRPPETPSNSSGAPVYVIDLVDLLVLGCAAAFAFVCSDYRTCEASHAGDFYEGQLHHVGRHYDLLPDGQPLRVVVIASRRLQNDADQPIV